MLETEGTLQIPGIDLCTLQFVDIAVYDEGKIVDHWPVFGQTAA